MPAMRLSDAHLKVLDAVTLVSGFHLCGGGFAGSGEVGVPEGFAVLWVWCGMVCSAVSGRRIACPSHSLLRARARGSSQHRHRASWCTKGGGG